MIEQMGIVSTVWSGDSKRLACIYPGGRRIDQTFDAIDRVQETSDGGRLLWQSRWIGPAYRELERRVGNGTLLRYLDETVPLRERDTTQEWLILSHDTPADLRLHAPDGMPGPCPADESSGDRSTGERGQRQRRWRAPPASLVEEAPGRRSTTAPPARRDR